MKRTIQIAPKQWRALMVLMLVLPLVPMGVLVRLLWEEQQFASAHSGDVWGLVAALFGMTFLITGVAARAVTRRMRIEEMQGDSLAAISHELKTPVSSTRVLLETLRDGDGEDRTRLLDDYLDLLLQENLRMGALVENFLNHTRLEQRRQRFRMEAVEASRLVEEAVGPVRAEVARRGGRLRCFGQGPGMPLVLADAGAMGMVLALLLDNALKYSNGPPDIEVDFFPAGHRAYFLVKDRGIGVGRPERRRIFEKFYQVDPKLSRRGGGCGLGLSIARHIVEAHGGEIRHERRRGRGSVFRIHLPAVEAPELRIVA